MFNIVHLPLMTFAWLTFRIFLIFFCSGGERGVRGAGRGGGRFLLKIPGGGSRGGEGRGAGRVSAAQWGIWRGGG